jgi:hypothetical protein
MIREVRRFNVSDDAGRLFIIVESALYSDDGRGSHLIVGPPRFRTPTGAKAIAGNVAGSYRIPSCGVTAREI